MARSAVPPLSPRWKNGLPVPFHVDHGPSIDRRGIERLVELSHTRLAVVGVFAVRIGVMHHDTKSASACFGRPLQHLEIPVRVPERRDRPAADLLVDPDRLAGAVVDEVDLRQAEQDGFAVAALELGDDA